MAKIYAVLLVFMVFNESLLVTFVPSYDNVVARSIAQIIVASIGGFVLLKRRVNLFHRYGIFFVYLLTNALSATFSDVPSLVLLHTGALGAIIIFSIAYAETDYARDKIGEFPVLSMVVALGFLSTVSLVLSRLAPELAYLDTVEGPRFRGVFGQPAAMAAVAAILLGISIFGRVHPILRYPAICVAAVVLFLTETRTYWVAGPAAAAISALVFRRIKIRKASGFLLLATVVAGLFFVGFDLRNEIDDVQDAVRWQSVEKLSGRSGIWQQSFEYFLQRPILGYGFTRGSDSFFISQYSHGTGDTATGLVSNKIFTLHNGYIQSLLDGGIVSFVPYLLIVTISCVRLIKLRSREEICVIFYICICLAIANLAETVIFTASVFSSVLFWSVAVISFSIRAESQTAQAAPPSPHRSTGPQRAQLASLSPRKTQGHRSAPGD